jgi:hypothetical protein
MNDINAAIPASAWSFPSELKINTYYSHNHKITIGTNSVLGASRTQRAITIKPVQNETPVIPHRLELLHPLKASPTHSPHFFGSDPLRPLFLYSYPLSPLWRALIYNGPHHSPCRPSIAETPTEISLQNSPNRSRSETLHNGTQRASGEICS